jgi:hypothetical protein
MKKSPRILYKEQVLDDIKSGDEERIMQYFSPCTSVEQLDWFFNSYLTKKDKERFNKFAYGSTCPLGGYYPWDVLRFFRNQKPLD